MKIILSVLAALVLGGAPAWAVLGEYGNSVRSDQQRMHAQLREVVGRGYSIQQLSSADGSVVREYVSSSGLVFGVSWQGPTLPDLQQLLGSYFAEFQQAARSQRRRHGPLVVRTDHLVVESGGHMRSFRGRAYAPSLLPANLSAEVVR
ncbi:MAG TPA: DUF2844 domain-containing protein [Terriglobia bacterium]|nr:DUF2844 domain-containing protein [Terriglobia bacterium]